MKLNYQIIKTSKFNRFHYEPRYYDAVKEQIGRKLKHASRDSSAYRSQKETPYHAAEISEAFRTKSRKSVRVPVLQLVIATVMLGTFIGWLTYGNDFFYTYLLLCPVYFYFRIRPQLKRKK